MKLSFVLFALIGLGLSSCERHTWETEKEQGGPKSTDTINLFKHEEGHAKDGEEHAKDGEAPKHGEKPAH